LSFSQKLTENLKEIKASEHVCEYAFYTWLLKNKPVLSIVIYTDDAVWRKQVTEQFGYSFDSKNGKQ